MQLLNAGFKSVVFSEVRTLKNGYKFEIYNSSNEAPIFESEKYTSYKDCVSDMELYLLNEEISDSKTPEILLDLDGFIVTQINLKARQILSVPANWEVFKPFSSDQETKILKRIISRKKRSENYIIQSYDGKRLIEVCLSIKAIVIGGDRLYSRISFGCPVLNSLLDAGKKFLS